ncbi:galactosylceramide sulfotransferase-like isoform X2 [Panulirus ornatus]|uniref:galactosylceramide sulfotransferase-like isoform X2 n=1 Tax=Panulirus ornatus TaxID=150431 RepID=UPI003A8A0EB4
MTCDLIVRALQKARTWGLAAVLVTLMFVTLPSRSPYPSIRVFDGVTEVATDPSSVSGIQRRRCSPHHNLMFLKTHKAASSTTQRIFLRYAKSHGLTLLLPGKGNYLGSPLPFRAAMVPTSLRYPDGTYNMMLVHTRLGVDDLTKVMKKDAVWVTIVREPLALWQSLWSYYRMEKFYKMTLEQFAEMPYTDVVRWRRAKRFGIHQMFFDMGYGSFEDSHPREIAQALKRLDKVFDLVMITERYDESLVLLKELMCWTTDDVAYLSINQGKEGLKENISRETSEKLRQLSQPDIELYNFFYNIFDRKVSEFGRAKMEREVQDLREANERLRRVCTVEKTSPNRAQKNMNWLPVVRQVAVRKDDQTCVDLVRTEMSFLDELRERQKAWVKGKWQRNISDVIVAKDTQTDTYNKTKGVQ